jgi:hypothetical protein
MRKAQIIKLAIFLIVLSIPGIAQNNAFDSSALTADGRKAYEELLNTKLFAFGPSGFSGGTSEGESALDKLVEEREALGALKALVTNATPEGGLYALVGLKMLRCDCFTDALNEYKQVAAQSEKEDVTSGDGEVDLGKLAKRATVQRIAGCLVFSEKRLKVVGDLEKGKDIAIEMAIDNFRAKKGK